MEIELDDKGEFKCPKCGETILSEEGLGECKHLLLGYTDMGGDFWYIKDGMNKLADKMLEDDDKSVGELMEEYAEKNEGVELYTITTSGMCCGPCSSTDYILIKE